MAGGAADLAEGCSSGVESERFTAFIRWWQSSQKSGHHVNIGRRQFSRDPIAIRIIDTAPVRVPADARIGHPTHEQGPSALGLGR